VPATTQPAPVQLPGNMELLSLLEKSAQRMRELEAENAKLRAQRTGPLAEEELQIGAHVAARVGADYVSAEIVNIYTPAIGGERYYELRRLDDGKKSLNLKPASDLFPPERAS
jgi:hypothetical protein